VTSASTPQRPYETIADPAALNAFWRDLMGPGGFAQRTLWLILLDEDDRVLPEIIPIDGIPSRPDVLADRLGDLLASLIGSGSAASAALLLSRPGPARMNDDDRCWARALVRHSPRWPVHLATADRIQVFSPDDLAVNASR